jgi:mono/diheme cytochrome c family protein
MLWLVCTLLAASLSWQMVPPAHSHETAHTNGGSSHATAMQDAKESIPDRYRQMEKAPFSPTDLILRQGEELFLEHCAVCHGEEGRGDGPAAKGMNPPPADFLDLEHSRTYKVGEKFWIVSEGLPNMGMPSFRDVLTEDERWYVIHFIHTWQEEGDNP